MEPSNPIPDTKNEESFMLVRAAVSTLKTRLPFVIGITGAGGAGKTTFATNIVHYFSPKNCLTIDLDDYLISREARGKLELTGYNPRANKLSLARKNIQDLKSRNSTTKPRYDHSQGIILPDEIVEPREIIVIEGVTTLYPELRELHDISFFLDAQEETQIKSRIERDVKQRGYTLEEALTLYESVKPDYQRHIAPTRGFASVIFEVGPDYVMHPVHIDPMLR